MDEKEPLEVGAEEEVIEPASENEEIEVDVDESVLDIVGEELIPTEEFKAVE